MKTWAPPMTSAPPRFGANAARARVSAKSSSKTARRKAVPRFPAMRA
jgi:hypothetical protein